MTTPDDGATSDNRERVQAVPTLPSSVCLDQRTYQAVADAQEQLGRLDVLVDGTALAPLFGRAALLEEAASASPLAHWKATTVEVYQAELPRKSKAALQETLPAAATSALTVTHACREAFYAVRDTQLLDSRVLRTLCDHLYDETWRPTTPESAQAIDWKNPPEKGQGHRYADGTAYEYKKTGLVPAVGCAHFDTWQQKRLDLPEVVAIAIGYRFLAKNRIFSDELDWISRLYPILQLGRRKILQHPVLPLSRALNRYRDEHDALLGRATDDDLDAWIAFFAKVLHEACVDQINFIYRSKDLVAHYLERIRNESRRATDRTMTQIIELLPVCPVTNARQLVAHLYPVENTDKDSEENDEKKGKKKSAVYLAARRLIELKILETKTRSKYDRVLVAPEMLDLYTIKHSLASRTVLDPD